MSTLPDFATLTPKSETVLTDASEYTTVGLPDGSYVVVTGDGRVFLDNDHDVIEMHVPPFA